MVWKPETVVKKVRDGRWDLSLTGLEVINMASTTTTTTTTAVGAAETEGASSIHHHRQQQLK
jgi:hypothetical protein